MGRARRIRRTGATMSCSCTAAHIGSEYALDPLPESGFKLVEFVVEGMRVVAACRHVLPDAPNPNGGVWCTVTVAAGTHARIVNEKRGIDRWVHISTLCVPR